MSKNKLNTKKSSKRFSMPNTAALLMIIIFVVGILTYIIPAGEFERIEDSETGRTLVVPNTYTTVEQSPISFWEFFSSVFYGIIDAADIIAFVFIVGGAFWLVIQSGAIHAILSRMIHNLKGREYLFIGIVMTAFAICGATFGMAEESLPFVTILIAASIAMGYDKIVAVSIVVIGIYAGYSAGPVNPFNVGIAQSITELPLFSGIGLRTVLMVGGLIIAIHHTLKYAKKIQKDPDKKDINTEQDNDDEISLSNSTLTRDHKLILTILSFTVTGLIIGVLKFDWYLSEISALLMLMGIIVGLITFKGNFNQFSDEFFKGAQQMTVAALLIGLSRAILVVMENGYIIDTFVYAISIPLENLNSVLAAWGMFISQGIINFIIPSSSGQAVVIMPIMSAISDVIDLNRQIAVQAFQSGDGYWNMITPTHPVLMAALGIAGVSFGKWFRFAWPLVLKWSIWTMIILAIGVMIDWGPF